MRCDDGFEDFLELTAQDEREEREEEEQAELARRIQDGEVLRLEDFKNPLFDTQRPVQRRVRCRGREELAYEGVTITDNFVKIGWTYFLADGILSIVNMQNQRLFLAPIKTPDDFEKAVKKADRKNRTLEDRPQKSKRKKR